MAEASPKNALGPAQHDNPVDSANQSNAQRLSANPTTPIKRVHEPAEMVAELAPQDEAYGDDESVRVGDPLEDRPSTACRSRPM